MIFVATIWFIQVRQGLHDWWFDQIRGGGYSTFEIFCIPFIAGDQCLKYFRKENIFRMLSLAYIFELITSYFHEFSIPNLEWVFFDLTNKKRTNKTNRSNLLSLWTWFWTFSSLKFWVCWTVFFPSLNWIFTACVACKNQVQTGDKKLSSWSRECQNSGADR